MNKDYGNFITKPKYELSSSRIIKEESSKKELPAKDKSCSSLKSSNDLLKLSSNDGLSISAISGSESLTYDYKTSKNVSAQHSRN